MPRLPDGKWVPGPNDAHIAPGKGFAEAGLGDDEPSSEDKAKMVNVAEFTRQRAALKAEERRIGELKKELKSEAAVVEQRTSTLDEREAEIAAREAEIERKLAELAAKATS